MVRKAGEQNWGKSRWSSLGGTPAVEEGEHCVCLLKSGNRLRRILEACQVWRDASGVNLLGVKAAPARW